MPTSARSHASSASALLVAVLAVAAAVPAAATERPVVWVQAGHQEPREPGYRAQTGAGTGPFGDEIGFTTRVAPRVAAILRRHGVRALTTPGLVRPLGGRGAAFVSVHHDAPGGRLVVGHAVTGASENYYRGEGFGAPSSTPYPDSAPHRRATRVGPKVATLSRRLANRTARQLRRVATRPNGLRSGFGGVADGANRRVTRYYGFYRTRADARIIVEAGAAGADDRFLARTDLISRAVAAGVLRHLRAEGELPPRRRASPAR